MRLLFVSGSIAPVLHFLLDLLHLLLAVGGQEYLIHLEKRLLECNLIVLGFIIFVAFQFLDEM